ncbi:hypothetical protein KY495_23920 [Massilia sp. PAMC28688]|uniref:hypothetical protein n=1 Tax=Massilia sp. PAMC28688 TaxID=2861283 RepID=UPI001C63504D|nr:hypothetical protein [Massilia sp. PAMC28688]QYF93658.1 hypothetical protein KY495_23920 [Massilia sp. PAMC28688]
MPSKPPPPPLVFRPHGHFVSRVEGKIIISEVTGPWNKELVEEWAIGSQPVALALSKHGPHVGIAVISGSMLCTPDALKVLREAAEYTARQLNCLAHVIVADKTVEGRDFVEPNFFRAYEGVMPLAIFYTLDEARAWALAQLAAAGA